MKPYSLIVLIALLFFLSCTNRTPVTTTRDTTKILAKDTVAKKLGHNNAG